jgi:hypothetical protein
VPGLERFDAANYFYQALQSKYDYNSKSQKIITSDSYKDFFCEYRKVWHHTTVKDFCKCRHNFISLSYSRSGCGFQFTVVQSLFLKEYTF